MILGEILLEKLANWKPAQGARQNLSAIELGWIANLCADRNDELSTAVWEFSMQRMAVPERRSGDLHAWAHQIADSVKGLLELLTVVEIDVVKDEAILRSTSPAQRSGDRYYYEVALKGISCATLRRFRAATPSAGREQVPFALTHESVARLAEDLAGIRGGE